MTIFKKEWSDFNFLVVEFTFPKITFNTAHFEPFGDVYTTGIDAPTMLLYSKEDKICWGLNIRLLGFGLRASRQYTY
jgi:hypothetical protein